MFIATILIYLIGFGITGGIPMKLAPIAFIGGLLVYLLLTVGSGDDLLYWSYAELLVALAAGILTGIASSLVLPDGDRMSMANPKRWVMFLVYLIPFFIAMAKANVDVAVRVITGKIKPGIVKINPKLKTKFGLSILANSITLTPGTLTVDVDEKNNGLFVHCINVPDQSVKECQEKHECDSGPICGSFPQWARRIAE